MKIFKQLTNWLFIFSLLLGIGWADVAGAVNKVRAFTAHIGGGVGALDKVATINMTEGDISIVVSSAIEYVYVWDDNGVDAEDAVNFTFIRPDDFVAAGSSGVWDLVSRGALTYTAAGSDIITTALAAAKTITGNWVNTDHPWAINEGGTGVATEAAARAAFSVPVVVVADGDSDPGVNDDIDTATGAATPVVVGYIQGDIWVNDTASPKKVFVCLSNANGTAVWQGTATNAEAVTGTATNRLVTAAGLTAMLASPQPIGATAPNTGNFTTITAGAAGFGVDATGDTTVASLIMPVTQDPLWWFNTTHASDTDWWIGTNADGTGDDNDAFEIRRHATPGQATYVDFRTTLNGTLWITQDDEELQIHVTAWTTSNAVTVGAFYFRIGNKLAGLNLVYVHAEVITAGTATAGDIFTVDIHNVTQADADILSTNITIDSTDTGSDEATAQPAIDADQDDMQENDVIRIDIDEIFARTASKGLIITLGFDIP